MQRRGSPLGRTRLGPRAAPMAAEGLALTLPWGRILPPLGAIFCCPAPKGTNPPPTEPQLRMMRGGLVASCAPRETAVAPEVSSAFTPARSGACLTLSCHAGFAGSTQVLRARQQAEESIPAQHCAQSMYQMVQSGVTGWMNKPLGVASRYQKDWHRGGWCTPPSAGALPEELLARLVSGAFGPALRLSPSTDAAALEGRAAASSSAACTACTSAGDVAAPPPVVLASGSACGRSTRLSCVWQSSISCDIPNKDIPIQRRLLEQVHACEADIVRQKQAASPAGWHRSEVTTHLVYSFNCSLTRSAYVRARLLS